MTVDSETLDIFQRIKDYELNLKEADRKFGWTWQEMAVPHWTITKLLTDGFIELGYSSNSQTCYHATEKLTAYLESSIAEKEEAAAFIPDVDSLFEGIVGMERIKELIKASLDLPKPIHILLVGPPALGKSMFIWEIERVYGPQALPMIGSSTSKSGMWDMIADKNPKIILIDELEKMHKTDQAGLLSLMEHGRLIRAKVGREMDQTFNCQVIATANRTTPLTEELISRFSVQKIKPYTDAEFVSVVRMTLIKHEGIEEINASSIADLLKGVTQDIRDAVRVGRLSKKVGVQKAIDLLM